MTEQPKCASHEVGYRRCGLWAKWQVQVRGTWWPVCGLHHRALTARFPTLHSQEGTR